MNTKEKAIELVDNFDVSLTVPFKVSDNVKKITLKNAKKNALFCVDEILKLNLLSSTSKYWQEVKQEIENYERFKS